VTIDLTRLVIPLKKKITRKRILRTNIIYKSTHAHTHTYIYIYTETMGDAISSLLFQPPPPTYLHPSRHFWLNTATGSRIPAFFIERPNAQVTILFSHGNAEDLGMIYDWFNDLARVLRVNIMAYDYTGYGKSNGAPCEENCYADIDAAFQYLLDVRRLQPEQIVLYGRSLGSGPSCFLAQKSAKEGKSVGGVILQSPLLSAYRVAFDFRFTMVGDKVCLIFIMCSIYILYLCFFSVLRP
jgi:pimeloyl-ACP methyl ester carboxylesterase